MAVHHLLPSYLVFSPCSHCHVASLRPSRFYLSSEFLSRGHVANSSSSFSTVRTFSICNLSVSPPFLSLPDKHAAMTILNPLPFSARAGSRVSMAAVGERGEERQEAEEENYSGEMSYNGEESEDRKVSQEREERERRKKRTEKEEGAALPGAPRGTLSCPDFVSLSDSELMKQCHMDTYRASGPGGQHRNKTESAVRLRHIPTGLMSQSCEQRSQHMNRGTALSRLRQAIALKVRNPVNLNSFEPSLNLIRILPDNAPAKRKMAIKQRIGPNHPDFFLGVSELLDVISAAESSVSAAAAALSISTGALSKLITSEKTFLLEVNDMRAAKGLKPLR